MKGPAAVIVDATTPTQTMGVNASGQAAIQNPPNLDAALSTLATEAKLEAVRALLATIDADTSKLDVLLSTRASEVTLVAADTKLSTIDSVLDSIKDTDGIKKITDELPQGTQEIGAVKQGTKAVDTGAWPFKFTNAAGSLVASLTNDAGVIRQEMSGKVQVTGAIPPPATTAVNVFADTPLTISTHDTTFTIPDNETFHLQEITAGNEDPTKGSVVELYFDDGTEHLVSRIYTNGETITRGFSDRETARDGTVMLGNGAGTSNLIVRRTKFSGTAIAIDAVVTGYRL